MYCHLLLCTHSGISLCNHALFSFKGSSSLAAQPWICSEAENISLWHHRDLFVSFWWQWPITCSAPSSAASHTSPCPWLCAGLPTGCLQASTLPRMISQLRNNSVSLWQPELKLLWVGKECSWFLSNLPAGAITQFWVCSLLLLWAFDTWMWNLLLTWLSLASMMDIKEICSVLISTNVLGGTSLICCLCQCLSAPAGLQEPVGDVSPTSHFVPNLRAPSQTFSGGETGDVLLQVADTVCSEMDQVWFCVPSVFLRNLCTSCCFIAFKSNLNFFCFLNFLTVFQICCFVSVLTCAIKNCALAASFCPGCSGGLQPLCKLQMGVSLLSCFVLMGKQACSCELRTNPFSLSSVFALEWLFLNSRCELSKVWKDTGTGLLGGLLNRISE